MRTVYFWWSASEVHGATLLRWKRMRMRTGGKDTNQLGVGPVVKTWLFGSWRLENARMSRPTGSQVDLRATARWFRNIRGGERVGYGTLRPYTPLYTSYEDAWARRNPIKRPTLKQLGRLVNCRKGFHETKTKHN